MERIWVQGVVKNGQVVLDAPLGVPDGTIMTVTDFDPDDDPRPISANIVFTAEELAEMARLVAEKRPVSEMHAFDERVCRARGLL
jgi:hypothetical protein